MIKEIGEFNKEVIGVDSDKPERLKASEKSWLLTALDEEIEEFIDSNSLVEDVDALIDLCYFAIGGLYRSGLNKEQIEGCFQAVHNANMSKAAGTKKGREGFDGVTDATKPEGWLPPEEIMNEIIYGQA